MKIFIKILKYLVLSIGCILLIFTIYSSFDHSYEDCIKIDKKLSLEDIEKILGKGHIFNETISETKVAFSTSWIAAGPIVGVLNKKDNLIFKIKCYEDGEFTNLK